MYLFYIAVTQVWCIFLLAWSYECRQWKWCTEIR